MNSLTPALSQGEGDRECERREEMMKLKKLDEMKTNKSLMRSPIVNRKSSNRKSNRRSPIVNRKSSNRKWHWSTLIVICHLSIVNLIMSCSVMADVYSYKGTVYVRPDQSTYTLPTLNYYFYSQEGDTLCLSARSDDAGNFSGEFADGDYRVIAVNEQAADMGVQDMERVETARMVGLTVSPRSRAVSPDGVVWRVVVDSFRVHSGETVTLTPSPDPLTRTVQLDFIAAEYLQSRITAITGTLNGIYPSVDLFTGETAEAEKARSPGLEAAYTAATDGDNPGLWTATLRVLGLYNPGDGSNGRSETTFTVTLDGESQTITKDLTEQISGTLAYYNGNLPIDISLILEIELSGVIDEHGEFIITAKVRPWSEAGGKTIIPI
jgi:hypothetical protein